MFRKNAALPINCQRSFELIPTMMNIKHNRFVMQYSTIQDYHRKYGSELISHSISTRDNSGANKYIGNIIFNLDIVIPIFSGTYKTVHYQFNYVFIFCDLSGN